MIEIKYERIEWEDAWKYQSVCSYGSNKEARIYYNDGKIDEEATYSKSYLEKKK